MPGKNKRDFHMMKGDSEKAKADVMVDKARAQAVKELAEAKGGFAVFFARTDKKGKTKGIQQIVAGAMGVEDTMQLAYSLREMSETLMGQLMQGFEEMNNEPRE